MSAFTAPDKLREHRSLLLAMECVGWFHMLGKCRAEFLRKYGGQKTDYDDLRWFAKESPPFPWDDLLSWLRRAYPQLGGLNPWPESFTEFVEKHRESNSGLLGLLQAGHGMASGIEKQSYAENTVRYLAQDATHMWIASPFGQPRRNLLADPPDVLTASGWARLVGEARRVLEELQQLGSNKNTNLDTWWNWRDSAIGPRAFIRSALASTVAETRLPNNDVTVWDQSYVAAALFKSAVAGVILEGSALPWSDGRIKHKTRWRLLTVGMGADHYEARAVRIGDWTGARLALDRFFSDVRRLVEVDLAVGSVLYVDGSMHVFSFPGERDDGGGAIEESEWRDWLRGEIDGLARKLDLETPPHCDLSAPTRSLVPMTNAITATRCRLALPVHRPWTVAPSGPATPGHTCPVCLVRPNGDPTDKQKPCAPCRDRRNHRLRAWLEGQLGDDTIWITEVADGNDRLALLTLSLDIEPWLDGTRVDALRAQAAPEWRRHNQVLGNTANPVDTDRPFESLIQYVKSQLGAFNRKDPVLSSLQEGYRHESDWRTFFSKIVEDRAKAPAWDELDDSGRARWIVHQLFRKLPSPGRVYRFWRESEAFFGRLLARFREEAAADANRWRVRRLELEAGNGSSTVWQEGEVYNGRLGEAPVSVLYREGRFVTVCNLSRLLRNEAAADGLRGKVVELRGDDHDQVMELVVNRIREVPSRLGTYHPVIPLELSPLRFRVLVPLEAASRCVDLAYNNWKQEMSRVWDRLPLRIGVVAFPRMVPFQAVIEAARSLEHILHAAADEIWRVAEREVREGVVSLRLVRPDGETELRAVPVSLPDGRRDVFYPYVRVSDRRLRAPLDFGNPQDGRIYRHVQDVWPGDGMVVAPARIATVFLESTGRRFEPVLPRPLAAWDRMQDVWRLLERSGPSQAALRGAWSELAERAEAWRGPDGGWLPGGREAWLALARALLGERLDVGGAALDHLVEAAADGTLEWAIEWHVVTLKQRIREVAHA
ncbi:MAG: CRISPR-associated protein Csx11 [Armatimonadota bacterium]|nr:CRISPR-associated protein Csx11 [Armatimonadota bacterium]MDR7502075.1 CRISPR-associated protein Csx11 [Armatimonadota bacterium]MDR7585440.1 CRISPR-associated protein Csx11 [Armatimonadota bacterium]